MLYQGSNSGERFRHKPIDTAPYKESSLLEPLATINALESIFDLLGVPQRFRYRRGFPLGVTVVGDSRAEEFVATKRYFGVSSSMLVIDHDSPTLQVGEQWYENLAEHPAIAISPEYKPKFVYGDIFMPGIVKPEQHVICGFGIHPKLIDEGGLDVLVNATAQYGMIILTKDSEASMVHLRAAIAERMRSVGDIEVASEGLLHLASDGQSFSMTNLQTPDSSPRPFRLLDRYAVALIKKPV